MDVTDMLRNLCAFIGAYFMLCGIAKLHVAIRERLIIARKLRELEAARDRAIIQERLAVKRKRRLSVQFTRYKDN